MDRLEFLKKMKTAVLAAGLLMMSTSCAFSGNSGNTVLNGDLKFTQADLSVKPFMEIEIETVADEKEVAMKLLEWGKTNLKKMELSLLHI